MSDASIPLRVTILLADRVLKNAVEGFFKELRNIRELEFISPDIITPALVLVQSSEASLANYHPDSTVVLIAPRRSGFSNTPGVADGWLYEDQLSPQTILPWIKLQMIRDGIRMQNPTKILTYKEKSSDSNVVSAELHNLVRSL